MTQESESLKQQLATQAKQYETKAKQYEAKLKDLQDKLQKAEAAKVRRLVTQLRLQSPPSACPL